MALVEAEDAVERCCWVENGVRCENAPVKGGPGLSCCADHCPASQSPAPGDE